ncbi:MAG TPA: efflux RND transporter periplasmic adaptor subunit [Myxococcaceae bacterium]|nr:efflux RND transporter periplasmic adaptor subunit [Myxococcaceae bacterium]
MTMERPLLPRRALALLPPLLLSACGQRGAPPPPPTPTVQVAPVQVKDVPVVRSYVGSLDGIVNAEIRARVPGYLASQDYKEGAQVKEGQLLFTIDAREYDAAVSDARANLQRAQAAHTNAEAQLGRVRPLAEQQAVSKQDLDTAVANEQQTAASVTSAKAAVERAELNLSYARMKSPIGGVAGAALVRVGNLVGQGQPTLLTTVSQTDPMRASFSITEEDYLRLAGRSEGKDGGAKLMESPVTLVLADGSEYPHAGKLLFVDRQMDPRTGTLRLDATFPNPDGLLRPGQTANVRFSSQSIQSAALVPERAVVELQGQFQTYVVGEDNVVHVRPVELGPKVEGMVVVSKGLKAGERVITEGLQKVRDGQKVNVGGAPATGGSGKP